MDYSLIRVKMEKELCDELYSLIDGEIIDFIMSEGKIESQKDAVKMIHQGQALSVTKKLTPDIYKICKTVQERLQFNEPIDFYIINSPEINAYAIQRDSEDQSHTVAINSGLIERFNHDELLFIIGHELGHLISGMVKLENIIDFVFPEEKEVPLAFSNKYALWRNLSELTADRYGFIASQDLDAVVSSFFKIASGLTMGNLSFSSKAYLEDVEETLEYFRGQPFSILGTHPINPVRIKAIQIFSKSELYSSLKLDSNKIVDDETLHNQTEELASVLLSLFDSEFDIHLAKFIAVSGILIASADNTITPDEVDAIVETLSNFTIFPKQYLDSLIEEGNLEEILKSSSEIILAEAPESYISLIGYLMEIVLADKKCREVELQQIFTIAETYLGVSKREVVRIIGEVIQEKYVPRMYIS